MSCYQGVGFSVAHVNELFTEAGTNSGQPYYLNASADRYMYYYTGYDTFYIDDVKTNPPTNPVEYYNLTAGTDPAGTYEVSSGPSYAGYIELVSCDGGGTEATTTFATSTASLNDVVFGLGIIIVIMSFTLVAFVYNSIKKPWH